MKTNNRDLLDDLFTTRRDAILQHGNRVLRRRRILRRVAQGGGTLAVLGLITLAALHYAMPGKPAPVTIASARQGSLTDEQLLALFPGTPKAIITVNGKKRLFFPRPADALRFVARAAPSDG